MALFEAREYHKSRFDRLPRPSHNMSHLRECVVHLLSVLMRIPNPDTTYITYTTKCVHHPELLPRTNSELYQEKKRNNTDTKDHTYICMLLNCLLNSLKFSLVTVHTNYTITWQI